MSEQLDFASGLVGKRRAGLWARALGEILCIILESSSTSLNFGGSDSVRRAREAQKLLSRIYLLLNRRAAVPRAVDLTKMLGIR